jgi:GNAT superfamily N-acetyltransferase
LVNHLEYRVFITLEPAPIPLHQIELSELMACGSHTAESEAAISKACDDINFIVFGMSPIAVLRDMTSQALRTAPVDCDVPGYSMISQRGKLLLTAFDEAGKIGGGIVHKMLLVLPGHRGKGLGSEILIRAFETGVMHPTMMNKNNRLTTAGRANRMSAHRIAVERAVRNGIDVSPNILEPYRHLVDDWMPQHFSI